MVAKEMGGLRGSEAEIKDAVTMVGWVTNTTTASFLDDPSTETIVTSANGRARKASMLYTKRCNQFWNSTGRWIHTLYTVMLQTKLLEVVSGVHVDQDKSGNF